MTLTGVFVLSCVFASGDVMQFNLGGVRKVEAVVQHDQEGYQCALSFVAVTCFAPATNRKINLSKSREYAIRALANAVGVTNGTVNVVKLTVSQPLAVNGLTASIKYKAENVEVTAASAPLKATASSQPIPQTKQDTKPDHAATDNAKQKSLLSCLDDMRSTLLELDSSLTEDIAALKPDNNFDDSVADLERKGVNDYQRLKSETQAEKLLLSTEKADFQAEVNQRHRAFIDRLTSAYTTLEHNHPREPKP